MRYPTPKRGFGLFGLIALLAGMGLLAATAVTAALAGGYHATHGGHHNGGGNADHVTICHATPPDTAANGYVRISPSAAGVYHGHLQQHSADIIPPFVYEGQSYSQNWDATGQAIWNNGCQVPAGTTTGQTTTTTPSFCEMRGDCKQTLYVTKVFSPHSSATIDLDVLNLTFDYNQHAGHVGDGDTVEFPVDTGAHTITESGQALNGYTASIACDAGVTGSNPWTVVVQFKHDIHCTITNTLNSSTTTQGTTTPGTTTGQTTTQSITTTTTTTTVPTTTPKPPKKHHHHGHHKHHRKPPVKKSPPPKKSVPADTE